MPGNNERNGNVIDMETFRARRGAVSEEKSLREQDEAIRMKFDEFMQYLESIYTFILNLASEKSLLNEPDKVDKLVNSLTDFFKREKRIEKLHDKMNEIVDGAKRSNGNLPLVLRALQGDVNVIYEELKSGSFDDLNKDDRQNLIAALHDSIISLVAAQKEFSNY